MRRERCGRAFLWHSADRTGINPPCSLPTPRQPVKYSAIRIRRHTHTIDRKQQPAQLKTGGMAHFTGTGASTENSCFQA